MVAFVTGIVQAGNSEQRLFFPLSETKGVPFKYWQKVDVNYVDGFTVDTAGNLYFMGGENSTLAKYNCEGEEIYRKSYKEFRPSDILVHEGKVYLFDDYDGRNNLFVLDAQNGTILKTVKKITENQVNGNVFSDEKLLVQVFDYGKPVYLGSRVTNLVFSLDGEYIGEKEHLYFIEDFQYPVEYYRNAYEYLGKTSDGLQILSFWNSDEDTYTVAGVSKEGEFLFMKEMPESLFYDQLFYGGIRDYWYLQNGCIYVLGEKDGQAMITKLNVEDMKGVFNDVSNTGIGRIVSRMDMDKNGIHYTEDGEGPLGFSVLDSCTFGLWDRDGILILTDEGRKIEKHFVGYEASHFDFTKEGDGFFAVHNKLYRLRGFKAEWPPLKVSFPLSGIESGRFRIDLFSTDSIRIIGQNPDFIVESDYASITNVKPLTNVDSLGERIIDNIALFVGLFEGKYLFSRFGSEWSPSDWQFLEYTPAGTITKRILKTKGGWSCKPFKFSYPSRMDREGNIYMMLKQESDLVIWKLAYNDLFPGDSR
jgi:hypothetical protein